MSTELLLRAAKTLREAVADLPDRIEGDWCSDGSEIYAGVLREWVGETLADADNGGDEVAGYIQLMHPPVALAVAAWLDGAAEMAFPSHAAFNVARAILREAS